MHLARRYIGSAVDLKSRWRGHLHSLRKRNHHSIALQRAWNKYGPDKFIFSVIEVCQKQELLLREQAAFHLFSPEYNVLKIAGSSLGAKQSDAAKEKMRLYRTGTKMSEETRAKISLALRGLPKSADAIAKTAAAKTGVKLGPMAEQHKAKIAAAHFGRKLTAEHSAKISQAKIGKPRPDMVGNQHGSFVKSEELRRKMSELQKGRPKSAQSLARRREFYVNRRAMLAAKAE